jgi:hypothetical protein
VKHLNMYLGRGIVVFVIMALFFLGSGHEVMARQYSSLYSGVRPLGMGNAFIAVADDENALFYNPAGLSRLSMTQIGIFNPLIEASKESIDFVLDAKDADLDDTGEVADLLRGYAGEHQHFRVGVFPHVGFNMANVGVMIGGLAQSTIDADIRNPVWPEAHVAIISDYGILGGAGLKLPITGLRAGAALKFIQRESLNETYTATDIAADDFEDRLEDELYSGSGLSADIGIIYQLPFFRIFDTNAALIAQNVPEMDMGDARDIDTQVHFGLSMEKSFAAFSLVSAFDYRDITGAVEENDDISKKIHLGTELKFLRAFSVRAGLNQGYFSAGATMDFWIMRFEFATYAVEVGEYGGQREDRRYVGQVTMGW